jgi:hypothetical protein
MDHPHTDTSVDPMSEFSHPGDDLFGHDPL